MGRSSYTKHEYFFPRPQGYDSRLTWQGPQDQFQHSLGMGLQLPTAVQCALWEKAVQNM